jgi:hypothetical protein
MPRPKPHYRLVVSNLQSHEQLKIELVDLPFASGRTFRLRVNGKVSAQGAGRQQDDRPAAIARLVGVALSFVGETLEIGIGSQFVDPVSRGQLPREVKAESGKLKTGMLTS